MGSPRRQDTGDFELDFDLDDDPFVVPGGPGHSAAMESVVTPAKTAGAVEQLLDELRHPASPESKLTPEMRHQLPEALQEMFISDEFVDSCMDHFERLDTNENGTLEMRELAPVITGMIANLRSALYASMRGQGRGDGGPVPAPMSLDECMGFLGLVFDQDGDGAISRGEFLYLCESGIVWFG